MDDKIIVTNRRALTAKYGTAGLDQIRTAVAALIDADAKRGIKGRLVFLDDGRSMQHSGGHEVTDATNPRQNKAAIDGIFRKENPEYLMILGAPDVVPHQDFANPLFGETGDPDAVAYGDLPYACDVPYSRDIARFKGPTRVVGRLSNLTGAEEPSHLLALLAHATSHGTRDVGDYRSYFRPLDPVLAQFDLAEPDQHLRRRCQAGSRAAGRANACSQPARAAVALRQLPWCPGRSDLLWREGPRPAARDDE